MIGDVLVNSAFLVVQIFKSPAGRFFCLAVFFCCLGLALSALGGGLEGGWQGNLATDQSNEKCGPDVGLAVPILYAVSDELVIGFEKKLVGITDATSVELLQ